MNKVLALFAALLFTVGLSACSGGDPDAGERVDEETELHFGQ